MEAIGSQSLLSFSSSIRYLSLFLFSSFFSRSTPTLSLSLSLSLSLALRLCECVGVGRDGMISFFEEQ
jgi:hypothetical protein